jgi:hypothetical protein
VKLAPDWRSNQVEPWRNWYAQQACLRHHEMRQTGCICIHTGQLQHRQRNKSEFYEPATSGHAGEIDPTLILRNDENYFSLHLIHLQSSLLHKDYQF